MTKRTVIILPLLAILFTKSNALQSGRGVCTIDVPSSQLIAEEDRALLSSNIKSNSSTPGYSRIEVCCSGYKLDCNLQRCQPECQNGCENGQCTAPNTCTCNHGFIKGPKEQCIRVCPWGCLHGVCSNDGRCSCNNGYTLHINGMYCIPSCYGGCGQGGECIAPNQCKCLDGYRMDNQGKCISNQYQPNQYQPNQYQPNQYQPNQYQPHQNASHQQTQYQPNQSSHTKTSTRHSSCPSGHEFLNGDCRPICSKGCRNGECISPERCICNPGWLLDISGAECTPHCDPPCANGQCTGPNQCTCNTGYINDPRRPHLCVAHCPGGCTNGICTSPNFCICNAGFRKRDRGSNECVPSYG